MENTETSTIAAFDSEKHLKAFYSSLYSGEDKSDSPDKTRASLLKRSTPHIFSLTEGQSMLDLGSGRQVLERQLFNAHHAPKCQIVTVDIADIPEKKLLMKENRNVKHVQADGSKLPFADGSFSLGLSNMALDLMPRKAISEFSRVLKSGAHAFLNLHHPFLIPEDLEELLLDPKIKKGKKGALVFLKYLKDNNLLFRNQTDIANAFANAGFNIKRVEEASNHSDKWWEVDLTKK